MTGDDKLALGAVCFWAVIIILMIFGVLKLGAFVWVKTASAISYVSTSYEDGKVERAAEKEKKKVESAIDAKETAKAEAAKRVARAEEKVAKKEREKAEHLAKLRTHADWDDEYGDAFYNADGTLTDPNPDDGYTAEQNYWILIFSLFFWFVVVCGMGSRKPLFMTIACIMTLIGAAVIWSW